MESMIALLLMLASQIQKSGTTDCTLHISSQPLAFNLLCPDIICRFEIPPTSIKSCSTSSFAACYLDNCNRIYHLCNTTQNLTNASTESSSTCTDGEQLGGERTTHNDEEHINCTFSVIPPVTVVRCQKRECILMATSTNTTCRQDLELGINCDTGHPKTCYREYNLCTTTEPQPTACKPVSQMTTSEINTTEQTFPEHTIDIHITEHNQSTQNITVQSSAKDVHASNYSRQTVYRTTTVHVSVCLTPTTSHSLPITIPSNVSSYPALSSSSSSSSICPCSLGSKISTTSQILTKTNVTTKTTYPIPLSTSSPVSETATMQKNSVTPTSSTSQKIIIKIDMLSITSINTSYLSPPACSPATDATTVQTIPLNIVAPAIGALVGLLLVLLLVVTTGWVCTCRTMRKRGGMKISLMEDSFPNTPNTCNGIQLYTSTLRTFDKSLCEEQKQATPVVVTPPTKPKIQHRVTLLTKPKPTHRQSGGPVYAIPVISSKRKHKQSTNIEDGANQIQSGIKQKGDQHSKTDERADSERGHDYHVLEGPGDDYDDSDKQTKGNVHHTLEAPIKQEKKPRNIYAAANMVLPDGGVSVGVAAPIQGSVEHEYDKLVKIVKQKGDQRKRDERVGSEREYMYHDLEGPGDDLDKQKKVNLYHILEGPTKGEKEPRNIHGVANKVLPDGGVSVGVATQIQRKQGNVVHEYEKPIKVVKQQGDQRKGDDTVDSERGHVYHILEGPGDDPGKQKKGNTYHILEGPTKGEKEPRNIHSVADQVLSGGGVPTRVATKIQGKQGGIEHEYDKLVKIVKQKGDQSKKDERVDSEKGYMYHVLEGPEDKYNDPNNREKGNVYHILEGPTKVEEEPRNIHGVADQASSGGGAPVGVATQIQKLQGEFEHQYDKLTKVEKQTGSQSTKSSESGINSKGGKEHVYHILEGPGGSSDNNSQDELERENVYHVLEGPTLVEEETQFNKESKHYNN